SNVRKCGLPTTIEDSLFTTTGIAPIGVIIRFPQTECICLFVWTTSLIFVVRYVSLGAFKAGLLKSIRTLFV
ncbi:MAG: hypothetical protein QGG39_12910, partial [Candidatus Poribacteria bacterium]|nr:hypothetical protein [Candidatus Poribacteria bacterium]